MEATPREQGDGSALPLKTSSSKKSPPAIGTEGPFLICRLTKKDWDQQRALKEVAKRLGISYKRIGFTGTKDKHAITSQLISIQGITPEEIGRVQIRDITLEPVGRSASPLALGSHSANRFTITIREITADPGHRLRSDRRVPHRYPELLRHPEVRGDPADQPYHGGIHPERGL